MFLFKFAQRPETFADSRLYVLGVEPLVEHMGKSKLSSSFDDHNPQLQTDASAKMRSPWGERIELCLAGKPQTWLTAKTGLSKSNLSDIVRKTMPGADAAIRIAQALEVPVEWLITGLKPHGVAQIPNKDDWQTLPRFTLAQLAAADRGDPIEQLPVHQDWLTADARRADGLWITDLPGDLADGTAFAGDMIVCHNAVRHDREGSYLYFFNDMALVRRLEGPSLDALREGRPIFDFRSVDPPEMRLVARILGVLKLRPI